jgi:hypothetical protein
VLLPLPGADAGAELLLNLEPAPIREIAPTPPPPPRPAELIRAIATAPAIPDLPALSDEERAERLRAILSELAAAGAQPAPALYQEFTVRCRMAGLGGIPGLPDFRRLFALALAGIEGEDGWAEPLALAAALPEEMLAPFMALARAAREGAPCPADAELARIYGTASLGRVKRMLGHMEERGVIVIRTDLAGGRSVALPHLGWTSAATEAGRAA